MAVRPRKPVPPHSKHPAPSMKSTLRHSSGFMPLSISVEIGVADRAFAVFAVEADQALGQNAIERRDKIVGLDTDVLEPTQHVDHVVGVNRCEDQMAGERRVDGDLGGLAVADFADHDLVRIVTQEWNADRARRVNPFFSLTGICVIPFNWYSTGSSIVMILRSSFLISLDSGVKRGSFAGARGAGDQHHAVGLRDVAAELRQIARD